jgi:hypothetical protein
VYRQRTKAPTLAASAVLAAALVGIPPASAAPSGGTDPTCRLSPSGNGISHVIVLTFDNVHFTRDNPNVPSDLEQMPHLLQFLTGNGVLSANHHTPLIAHTGTDILTALTGVYGDHHGQPISNSYRYYTPTGTSNPGVTFAYWTDGVFDPTTATPTDPAPTMVRPDGKVAPAPWVPFTRAGCDVGAVASANTILENVGPDVPKVFGPGSPEAAEAKTDPELATTDFVGIGVHCATGSARCAAGNAKADLLPDEPGGYAGFQGLFGAKYVNPVISPNGPVTTVDRSAPVVDAKGRPGFPGFDGMSAANTLGYVAQMQESGVPVTFGYISDAHDRHPSGGAYGPGEAGYIAALKSYDDAFATFFDRLGADGITPANTTFIVTSDENDHFVGGPAAPVGCDGIHTPCTYAKIGEVNANIRGLLATQQQVTTPFQAHADSAPNFYLDGAPAADAATTRAFEHAVNNVTTINPYNGQTQHPARYFADVTEQRLLHMVTGDPLRTPTFTTFADPDYFVFAGAPNCTAPCVTVNPAFAWNHGDFSPDINVTWLGITGPGVRRLGVTDRVWSDHTDVRPTLLALLGLTDDYRSDGRALWEFVEPSALPVGLRGHRSSLNQLGEAYKQLNACVGEFGTNTLVASTNAIVSDTPGDARFRTTTAELTALGAARDAVAGQIAAVLDDATFHGGRIDERQARALTFAARAVIALSGLAAAH